MAERGAPPWLTVIAVPVLAASASPRPRRARNNNARPAFTEVDLVSNIPGRAAVTDANVQNAWGLALSPTSPLWVANNGTNTATLYAGGIGGAAPTVVPLVVTIPGGAPTGQVFNGTSDFVVTGPGGSRPARFLFVSEGGDLVGWNPTADPVVAGQSTASLPGTSTARSTRASRSPPRRSADFLFATDFHNGRSTSSTRRSTLSSRPRRSSPTRACRPGTPRSTSRRSTASSTSPTRSRTPTPRTRWPARASGSSTCSSGRPPRAAAGQPRAAERPVGPGDRAGQLRRLRRRPAGRQLRGRPDQRLRPPDRARGRATPRSRAGSRSRSTACGRCCAAPPARRHRRGVVQRRAERGGGRPVRQDPSGKVR